jgi:hypothetical protein
LAVSGTKGQYPQFKGNVLTVELIVIEMSPEEYVELGRQQLTRRSRPSPALSAGGFEESEEFKSAYNRERRQGRANSSMPNLNSCQGLQISRQSILYNISPFLV